MICLPIPLSTCTVIKLVGCFSLLVWLQDSFHLVGVDGIDLDVEACSFSWVSICLGAVVKLLGVGVIDLYRLVDPVLQFVAQVVLDPVLPKRFLLN